MKSKTSFFNKAVFRKNVVLYWPIWVSYLLYGLIKVPGRLWYFLQGRMDTTNIRLMGLGDSLHMQPDIIAIAVVAAVTGMAVFNYLFTSRSANMIHALPVTRMELFVTNVVSGLSFMLVPQIIVFFTAVILCLATGITAVQYLLCWLVSVMAIAFFLFSLVSLCAMLTGVLFALPVYFIVMNYLAVGFVIGMRYVLSFLGYGIDYFTSPDGEMFRIFSPLNYLIRNVEIQGSITYDAKGDEVITGMTYTGGMAVAGYAAVAVFIYLLAAYCYKKRRIERTGDLLSFGWLKPVFRWGVGICFGFTAGLFIGEIMNQTCREVKSWLFFALVILFGVVGFFIAEMFVQKAFAIFKNGRRWKECGVFIVFAGAVCGAVHGFSVYLENYIPKEEQIAEAYIQYNYPVEFTGEDVGEVVRMQKSILSKKDAFLSECRQQNDNAYISVTYRLKNGEKICRNYMLPIGTESSAKIAEQIYGYESEPDNFMRYVVGYDYSEITEGTDTQLEYYGKNQSYVTRDGDGDAAMQLYRAVIQDVREGTLQKYNLNEFVDADGTSMKKYKTAGLYLYYRHKISKWQNAYQRVDGINAEDEVAGTNGINTVKDGYSYVYFGEDCANIIQTLIESGMIQSEKELRYVHMGENY